MPETNSLPDSNPIIRTAETAIRLALFFLILYWCYSIIKPFTDILLWSVIFAVAFFPMYNRMQLKLHGKKVLSAVLIILIIPLVLILPGFLFAKSLYEGIAFLKEQFQTSGNRIPEASEKIASWLVVGPFLFEKYLGPEKV